MKRIASIAVVAAVLAGGCGGTNERRDEAYGRWQGTRSQVIYGVGDGCLKAGDLKKAERYALEAIDLDEKNVSARILLAKVLLENGKFVSASQELDKAMVITPNNGEVAYLQGVALEKRRSYAEALKCYQRARALDDENDEYLKAAAEVLVSMGKPRLALELLEPQLERDDCPPKLTGLAGKLALLVKEPVQAAELFRRYLDAEPENLSAREGLAKAHFFAEDYVKALDVLKKLSVHPEYADKAAWVYILMGNSYLALNYVRDAHDSFTTVSRITPDDPTAWLSLAKTFAAMGDPDGTITATRRVMAIGGDGLEVVTLLGYALICQDRLAEAKKLLIVAIRRYPKELTLRCMLGRCHEALGEKPQAIACYEQTLQDEPDHRLARMLLDNVIASISPEDLQ